MRIEYEAENFPPSLGVNGSGYLDVSWDDLVWAAVTIGRPGRAYLFQHGASSVYEAIFRCSLVRMALEQRGARSTWFTRTPAFKALDPTEKGAVSYFLGMVLCKLFAHKVLNTPWLLHLGRGLINSAARV